MSPILVRPVREQLEHDRVIRLLQAKYKRKYEVAINPGNEQTAPVGTPPSVWYPDLVLLSTERSRKLMGTVEVETTESINNLEAMSQWVAFAKLKAPFHLYVPAGMMDSTRRLCADLQIPVAEIWAYHSVGDQIRFTVVHRVPQPGESRQARPAAEAPVTPRAARPAVAPAKTAPTKTAPTKTPAKAAAPVARPAAARPRAGAASAARPAAVPRRNGNAAATVRGKTAVKAKAAPATRRVAAKAPARKAASPSRAQKRR